MMSELDPAATAMTRRRPISLLRDRRRRAWNSHWRAKAGLRADFVGALVCGCRADLAIASSEELVRHGTLAFLADGDDVLYLAISRLPYHGEPYCATRSGPWRSGRLYSWMQFVPGRAHSRARTRPLADAAALARRGGMCLGCRCTSCSESAGRHAASWPGLHADRAVGRGFVGGQTLLGVKDLVRGMLAARRVADAQCPGHFRVVTPLLA